ncbi:hypothetical protein O6P43_022389 [Quillaja saponaria]|uniref:Uncharacterized protein n=1 Tax=Quillaja saponaria TaxID=32244 RepID=A0AAD7LD07_QUISA|nr:hypothetical protein O6P43_022389 [Quillaja saponaria]
MGFEILEEFRPIAPIRIVSTAARTAFKHRIDDLSNIPEKTTKDFQILHLDGKDDEEECHTPRSPTHMLEAPSVCPPAPKKPRLMIKKRNCLGLQPPQPPNFFQVPHDLASVFMVHTAKPSKTIRAST